MAQSDSARRQSMGLWNLLGLLLQDRNTLIERASSRTHKLCVTMRTLVQRNRCNYERE